MTQEDQRVRDYLMTQGENYSFSELWTRTIEPRLELIKQLSDVTQMQANFSYDEDEWTISEIVDHVLASTEKVSDCVSRLSCGLDVDTSDVDPIRKTSKRKIDKLRNGLLEGALSWTTMTTSLPQKPNYRKTSNHSSFGDMHSGAWYLFQRLHDLDHLEQIITIKSHSNYPST